jgi:hypothetical protein
MSYPYVECIHISLALHFFPQVAEAEDKTPGGLILTETTKEKPSIGTVSPCHQF